jgi:hypothetical protein
MNQSCVSITTLLAVILQTENASVQYCTQLQRAPQQKHMTLDAKIHWVHVPGFFGDCSSLSKYSVLE